MKHSVKPKILFVAYQVERGSNGGMESATRIFEALASDFQWILMTNRETSRTERWRAGGAQIVIFSFDEQRGKIVRGFQLALAAVKVFRHRADILHGNDIRAAQILVPAVRIKRAPFAFTLRGMKPDSEKYGRHWESVARLLDALVTLSDDMAGRVSERFQIPKARCHTIRSIVDCQEFRPLSACEREKKRATLGISNRESAIGIVGGVFGIKRQLEVISQVVPYLMDMPFRLHIVGDFNPANDSYARACAAIVKAKALEDHVVFHGFQDNVVDYLASLDVVLVASQREGLARCMIEAMACGTPVVSTDVCSAREVLESTGAGVVVRSEDWPGLVSVLRDLCSDPAKRSKMGRSGREAAIKWFSSSRVADDWRDLYAQLNSRR